MGAEQDYLDKREKNHEADVASIRKSIEVWLKSVVDGEDGSPCVMFALLQERGESGRSVGIDRAVIPADSPDKEIRIARVALRFAQYATKMAGVDDRGGAQQFMVEGKANEDPTSDVVCCHPIVIHMPARSHFDDREFEASQLVGGLTRLLESKDREHSRLLKDLWMQMGSEREKVYHRLSEIETKYWQQTEQNRQILKQSRLDEVDAQSALLDVEMKKQLISVGTKFVNHVEKRLEDKKLASSFMEKMTDEQRIAFFKFTETLRSDQIEEIQPLLGGGSEEESDS
jgi:hypothetical protein